MAKPLNPAFFAVVDRALLIGLDFAPASRKAFWKSNPGISALAIATELCREQPAQMIALRDRIQAKPQRAAAHVAAVPRAAEVVQLDHARPVDAARLEQQDALSKIFGTGAYAHDAKRVTTWDPRTCTQTFGVGVAK